MHTMNTMEIMWIYFQKSNYNKTLREDFSPKKFLRATFLRTCIFLKTATLKSSCFTCYHFLRNKNVSSISSSQTISSTNGLL